MVLPALLLALLPSLLAVGPSSDEEKALREALEEGLSSPDASVRAQAVAAYGDATRDLPDGEAGSKLVARTLGKALEDDSLEVRGAAVATLAWGRHPDTVIDVLDEALEDLHNEMEKTSTRPDAESRTRYRSAQQIYARAAQALGNYPDDRSVDVLAGELRALQAPAGIDSVAQDALAPLARALTTLGSREAVEAAVDQTARFTAGGFRDTSPSGRVQTNTARRLHEALAAWAAESGPAAPPAFSETYDQAWRDWLQGVEDELPRRLGKLKEPPPPPLYEAPDRRERRRRPGERERP